MPSTRRNFLASATAGVASLGVAGPAYAAERTSPPKISPLRSGRTSARSTPSPPGPETAGRSCSCTAFPGSGSSGRNSCSRWPPPVTGRSRRTSGVTRRVCGRRRSRTTGWITA
ncbi:twin-arginine translocation signal domain-containing protein [Actinosynnema sp. ALI-1.44]|uniref:twin-arginine translocation signal domain-containing protein n=1 Tax=Actinosynnema sp. ALI-1.44 TaxID=1933779 RepID=UPI003F8D7FFC